MDTEDKIFLTLFLSLIFGVVGAIIWVDCNETRIQTVALEHGYQQVMLPGSSSPR